MTEDQDGKDSQSDSGGKGFANKNKDKKPKAQRPLTKIILRRLPPTMTEEAFLEQVSPIPEHDHFYFARPDTSLGNNSYSRAYINFVNVDDIYLFRDKFDGYIFLDEKGVEYVGIVEYAPFQRTPKKKKKKDPKCGTITSDPIYQEFVENLTKEPETENQPKLEYSYPVNDSNDKKMQTTPLLEYLASRKIDKRGRDERRRRENDKRKMRIERKTKEAPIKEEDGVDNEVKKIKSREWEKEKPSKFKDESEKVDTKDVVVFESKTFREQRKSSSAFGDKKKPFDKEDDKKDKKDKIKESPRDQKSKKYSDTRKERMKQSEPNDRQSVINKFMYSEGKSKSLNHDDIKPFTQLPQVKTEDFNRMIEDMDRKMKLDEASQDIKIKKSAIHGDGLSDRKDVRAESSKMRRSSEESDDLHDDFTFTRQKSMEERGKSTDREGSEEKDKCESSERRAERRIRNKDRPSMVIYQPGMGRFSKQRLAKEKEPGKPVSDSEKKDT